jgi:hypothetical protein
VKVQGLEDSQARPRFFSGLLFGQVKSSSSGGGSFRSKVRRACGKDNVVCELTGEVSKDDPNNRNPTVIPAHLIPKSSELLAKDLGVDVRDSQCGVFLAKAIEVAYDSLKLSFMPHTWGDPNVLCMYVWDKSILGAPICEGDKRRLIRDFENTPLRLHNGRKIYTRCLYVQAVEAWEHFQVAHPHAAPGTRPRFGSQQDILEKWQADLARKADEAEVEKTEATTEDGMDELAEGNRVGDED